jgi:hypothetical protein
VSPLELFVVVFFGSWFAGMLLVVALELRDRAKYK